MSEQIQRESAVPAELAGKRLDQTLAEMFPEFSRSRLKKWLLDGQITVDGGACRPRDPVLGGETVRILAELASDTAVAAEPIPLNVLFEDDHLIVIDKPPGLVVHPGAGNRGGTLQNALLARAPELATLPRAGIVHRLDRLTSGVMIVARSLPAHTALVQALQAREVSRTYVAVATGVMTGGGTVDEPIGRHPKHRTRMAVRHDGREAVTHYRVIERYRGHTLARVNLETGRTHQIRVHLAHIRYPLVGDPDYGGRLALPRGCTDALAQALRGFRRQALHARELSLAHPVSGETVTFEAPVPADFSTLVDTLRADVAASDG